MTRAPRYHGVLSAGCDGPARLTFKVERFGPLETNDARRTEQRADVRFSAALGAGVPHDTFAARKRQAAR